MSTSFANGNPDDRKMRCAGASKRQGVNDQAA